MQINKETISQVIAIENEEMELNRFKLTCSNIWQKIKSKEKRKIERKDLS